MAEVNIPVQDQQEDQAHIDAMVAKADAGVNVNGQQNQANPTDGKPDYLGDFDSPEEMAKAYQELRAKMSQDGAPKGDDKQQQTPQQPDPNTATPDEAAKAVEAAGIDMASIEGEFMESGELSAETYDKLAKAGFDENTVNAYIAGQQALAEQMQSHIEQHVGGADKLQSALEWAATGLTQEEQIAFNNAVDTSDEAGLKLAMDGLMAKYANANGNEPNLIGGGTNRSSGAVFRSTAELTKAMNDPRYSKDPAYRADVEQRLANSDIF